MPGMKNGKSVKLPWVHINNMSSGGAGTATYQVYRMNSIFDPDFTGGGTQPLARDEFSTFYTNYIVTGCKMITTFRWSSQVSSTGSVVCFAFPNELATAPSSLETKMLRYAGKWRVLQPNAGGAQQTCRVTNYFSAKKFFHIKDVDDEHQLKAAFSSSPFKQAYLVTGLQDLTGGDASSAVDVVTTFSFTVKLLDPIPILGS